MKTAVIDITSIDPKKNREKQALKKDTSEATTEEDKEAKRLTMRRKAPS